MDKFIRVHAINPSLDPHIKSKPLKVTVFLILTPGEILIQSKLGPPSGRSHAQHMIKTKTIGNKLPCLQVVNLVSQL